MSWLTNIISNNDGKGLEETKKNAGKTHLYITVENTRVCFLEIDESVSPNRIVSREEFFLGPIEDLEEGVPVRDLFGTLLKLFTAHKEILENKETISVAIPAEGVFFRNIEVPKLTEADMQKLVFAEIKKTLPVDFSQVLLAQNDLGTRHENMKSFFCVGIQKMLFENFKSLFLKFNLAPYFEIEVFSLARIAARDNIPKLIVQIERVSSYLIFLEGQIIQDVRLLDFGANDINKNMQKDLGLTFSQIETLKNSYGRLQDNGRMGVKIIDEYTKELTKKIAKNISMQILDYEKKQTLEIKEVVISGIEISSKIKKAIVDEFDAELKVDFINERNFGNYVSDNFSLDELKRYAQCFGLAQRRK